MADLKISALTASTTPLAGTEVLPIVQSGTTKQVSVANLTAGRAVSTLSVTATSAATDFTNIDITNTSTGGVAYRLASGGQFGYFDIPTGAFAVRDVSNSATRAYWTTAGNQVLPNGNLIMGTAGKGTVFGNGAGVSFKGILSSATVSTTPTTCSDTATSGGGVVYISGYNASGGNRFVALIGFRDTVVTPIYLDNNTGLVLSFTASSNVLRLATVSGTVICSSVSLTV